MTAIPATLDACLDDYDEVWQRSETPPSLMQFFERKQAAFASEDVLALARELALIDLEHRWRRFFCISTASATPASEMEALPQLPSWQDYCRLFEFDAPPSVGVQHEFRVRQLFGDRPDCRLFANNYAPDAVPLSRDLSECAAQLTRAKIAVFRDHRLLFETRLPGHLEIGRRRSSEPAAPSYTSSDGTHRLLIAQQDERLLSRRQIGLQFIALNRMCVENLAPAQGRVLIEFAKEIPEHEPREVEVPCRLCFSHWIFAISVSP